LLSLSHPNILHFLCGFTDEEKKECFLVMELMNSDLYSYIRETCGPRKRIPFPLPIAVDLMLQIDKGMEYIH
jgi:serine/threonine protein kinase